MVEGLTSQILNDHYVSISIDSLYRRPLCKLTGVGDSCQVMEYQVFCLFDTLRPIATGFDDIPAWFLRTGAPIFVAPVAQLFSQSVSSGNLRIQGAMALLATWASTQNALKVATFRLKIEKFSGKGKCPPNPS